MRERINIICDINEAVSFAMQQNHVPVIRRLMIKNTSDTDINNLLVTIATDPGIADEWSTQIDSIGPGREYTLDGIDLRLSPTKLSELTERINGTLSVTVTDGAGDSVRENRDLAFLSYDEWIGKNIFPEFLAAFITPNHPYVTEILKKAGNLLSTWTGSPSFTGYQSKNPNNVKKQMAAIYGALQQENIVYCAPPASFEENGQKIRLSGTIREQKLGTCLDLTLLYAGCLEAAGLNAIINIMTGHAFPGCWLEEETFVECVQDDVSLLTKRIATGINEICLVESTAFTSGNAIEFETAVAAAENHLKKPDDFAYLVDIKRSRGSGIRPIPQKRPDGSFYDGGAPKDGAITGAPDDVEFMEKLKYVDAIEFTRQQMWERKLLDLSLRNSLLNYRVTKNSIQLLVDSLHDLEDALSGGEEFTIIHRPHELLNTPRDNKIYEALNNESVWNTLIRSEFQKRRIRTFLDEASLASSILAVYRSSRASMEENGANTLYLALGFLKWYESEISEKPLYAPMVLIPIEIIRKSAQRGYVFRLRDDEPIFNITLLEMLRMNYGINVTGLDPIPLDDKGIDVKRIFFIVRQLIMNKPRWDVEELAFIGIFAFTRFIMWNDIRNRVEDLKRNKIVSSLISGKMEWESKTAFLSPEELDDGVKPMDLAVPISADSSQLAAIHAAGQDCSFVLHGPPGTGKSQTITNIIANALYQGKTVLFAAEKMAALTVVQKRLEAIGLGDFCLELHSNKARKKDVLDQLEKTLNLGRIKSPDSYLDEAAAIYSLRGELNDIVKELHKPRLFGFSLYEAISRAEQYAGYPECGAFSGAQIDALTSHTYARWVDLCEMASAAAASCGGVREHPLREYKNPHYSQTDRTQIEVKLKEYGATLSGLVLQAEKVCKTISFGKIETFRQYEALAGICLAMNDAVRIPSAVLLFNELPEYRDKINMACSCGTKRDAAKVGLGASFSDRILDYDAETALLRWNQAEADWFLPKLYWKSKIRKQIKLYALEPSTYNKKAAPEYLRLISDYQKNDAVVKSSGTLLENLFGAIFDGGNGDWALIEKITRLAISVQELVAAIAADASSAAGASFATDASIVAGTSTTADKSSAAGTAPQNTAGAAPRNVAISCLAESLDYQFDSYTAANRDDWAKYASLMADISSVEADLSAKFANSFEQWRREPDWPAAMSRKATRWMGHIGGLRDYCGYLRIKSDMESEGIATVCEALESGAVKENELRGAFIKTISKAFAAHIIENTPSLNDFHGALFSQKIEKFKELNKRYEIYTKQELASRLSAQVPVLSAGVSNSSEIGILQRAIKSGGRMTPIRKLFESIPNLIRKLSPCMLMSPISVAQYLDPKFPAFDLVVFDEASQLPTSEAVGVIARGNELIVVGDPKQLPPTSFFVSNQIDEDNYEKEDLESVLDDCLALSMPQEHLLWHYRSRHESLIAFSNKNYYEDKLYTFPSPNDMVSQVRLIPVEGFYDRGKTKQNKAEAEAIVAEIIRRLSDPVLKSRSIGVVTFSSVQQNLIADLLESAMGKNPNLDELANNAEEPIFVKNLENVQGDERDVILFSVGYGPDEQGRVALNFGPLNREGGWRRLNVAVSRARYEMMIFSVLKPEQIDLNRTRSDGLAGLKSFLEFAAKGADTGAGVETSAGAGVDAGVDYDTSASTVANVNPGADGLTETIAHALRKLGYAVNTNIGCSGYHVDIGIIHPQNPESYVLGILCDSGNYYNGGTALDRNDTQQSVLQGLGWNISRIWALDWWEDADKELSRIRADIENALRKDATKNGPTDSYKTTLTPSHSFEFEKEETPVDELKHYTTASLSPVAENFGSADGFVAYASRGNIKRQAEAVMQAEAPVSRELLCKRILDAWGISRMGARINRQFDEIFTAMKLKSTKWTDNVFFWKADDDPEQYDDFRAPHPDENFRRNIEQIPPEEIASAVKYVLIRQIGLPGGDLEKEVARLFGFGRCTEPMQNCIRLGVNIAVGKGWAAVDGAHIRSMI